MLSYEEKLYSCMHLIDVTVFGWMCYGSVSAYSQTESQVNVITSFNRWAHLQQLNHRPYNGARERMREREIEKEWARDQLTLNPSLPLTLRVFSIQAVAPQWGANYRHRGRQMLWRHGREKQHSAHLASSMSNRCANHPADRAGWQGAVNMPLWQSIIGLREKGGSGGETGGE